MNNYISVEHIENKYSSFRLCKILKELCDYDKGKKYPRVYFLKEGRFKKYFVRKDCVHCVQFKYQKKSNVRSFFVTVRICRGNYDNLVYADFIAQFHKAKPSLKIEYAIEGNKNQKHLHFIVRISKYELLRLLKYLRNNDFQVLKYLNASMSKIHEDFFKLNKRHTTPIYITEVDEENNLRNYLQKETEIKIINKNGK